MQEAFKSNSMVKAFCYVDGYLIIYEVKSSSGTKDVHNLFGALSSIMPQFVLTGELPVDGQLRFLGLRLLISQKHVCLGTRRDGSVANALCC